MIHVTRKVRLKKQKAFKSIESFKIFRNIRIKHILQYQAHAGCPRARASYRQFYLVASLPELPRSILVTLDSTGCAVQAGGKPYGP